MKYVLAMSRLIAVVLLTSVLFTGCSPAEARPPRSALPPIPNSVWTPVGRATIRYEAGMLEKEAAVGKFDWPSRTITLDSSVTSRTAAWLTLEHERVHITLMDHGIQMDEETEERVADAIAAARVAQMIREGSR